ncbi:HlyD family secretion protein [Iodobacter sp.]|uniref:HlyD family secretion protein n=1 Tax=Iodobacter sp. TaxID=1915058 RepID=UPI0025DFE64E|nr:HlyD family efflux transporter periplasmic adaptor subunit [Iodobacter sp.]
MSNKADITTTSSPFSSLFRRNEKNLCGSILLAHPVSYDVLTGLFIFIIATAIIFSTCFEHTKSIQLAGVVLPEKGLLRVFSGQEGVVLERRVMEGQMVAAGDVLFVLSRDYSSGKDHQVKQGVADLLQSRRNNLLATQVLAQQQLQQHLLTVQQKNDELKKEVLQIDFQMNLQQRRLAIADEVVNRYHKLQVASFISTAGLQDKLADQIDQQLRLADLQKNRMIIVQEIQKNSADLRDIQIQMQQDRSAKENNISSLDQEITENEANRKTVIRATKAGVVSAISTEQGEKIIADQVLANISPLNSPLEGVFFVPSRAIGFAKPGMDVLLRYQAYPYQKYGQFHGKVKEISNTPLRLEELALYGLTSSQVEPLYRIKVALPSQVVASKQEKFALKTGMVVDASLQLESRKLYQWILAPLFNTQTAS